MHFRFAVVIARRTVVLLLLVACARHEPAPVRAAAPPVRVVTPQLPKPADAAPVKAPDVAAVARDLPEIAGGGVLCVLFTFNSTGYFLYRGETLGYEYELLTMFARDAKLRIEPVVIRDSTELFDHLNRGDGDVVAAQLSIPSATSPAAVAITDSLYETAPVVVQRSPSGGTATPTVAKDLAREEKETPSTIEVRARLISTPRDLAGQQVQIPRTSPYRQRLVELNEELTQDIDVVEVDESSDRLIQELAEGEIALTVAAENVAALKSGEYTNLIIKPAIGPPQPVVWAVRRNAPQLLAALNQWLAKKRKAGLLAVLYRKYFLDRRAYTARINSPFLTAETGTLSPYDDWFREYARIPGWDWRLVAAQAFQESRFNPRAHSWAGAVGLMQIMPRTARQLHANAADPKQSVEAACRYLWTIDAQWKEIKSDSERIKFILASYNVGTGHVQDAVRLAAKNGDDPHSWLDVSYWLIRKSKRSVYNDPVVKHGFARGTEPVAYVDQILLRWHNYKEFVKEPEPAVPQPTY
ncbi:MAG TPA: transglycosylase SLT domain-containing protein [Thermoanaerobaculia bacterium]|jgi:membrane-bound lytic murein transglycosylase F|nr:transglycosylase SLT domain-containing protein [Thermoanaerobaculia bacterium]